MAFSDLGILLGDVTLAEVNHFTKNPMKAQKKTLKKILKKNKNCELGKKFNFANINSIADYQKMVPLSTYDDYAPYVDRMIHNKVPHLLYIDDTPRVSVDYIVENAKRQVIDRSIDVVFIDMMTLIRQECDSWELHIQQLISKLSALAEELNIVVIGSLRVNRNLRIDGYRNMTDLKDLIYIESSPRDRTRLKVEYYVNMTLFSEALIKIEFEANYDSIESDMVFMHYACGVNSI